MTESEYTSDFVYFLGRCFSVYYRPGAYLSFGVHIGRDLELHFLWWILMLMPEGKGKDLEEADNYYLKGIEP